MFLTKMTVSAAPALEALVARLPRPPQQLFGRRAEPLALPDNIVCFQRRAAAELRQPRRGRALHHRHVLIFALRTAVTVAVDDRAIRLAPGEGLLVFPFQFHHYLEAERDRLQWLFVTFDLADSSRLATLRFQPFRLTPPLRALAAELLVAHAETRTGDLPVLLLAVMLERLRRQKPLARRPAATTAVVPDLVTQVNQLAQRSGESRGNIKQLARELGISQSHLRARFRASCGGVSLGRHLRRLRLEKACGLLRLTPNRVSEVAEQCGFTSIYSFSRAFRTAYGVSPLGYRSAGNRTE